MPLNRDWMDVARYLDGGAHPEKLRQTRDRLVAACELQRLQMLAWTSALRGSSLAAGTTRGRIRDGIAGVRIVLQESAALHAAIAARRSAEKTKTVPPRREPPAVVLKLVNTGTSEPADAGEAALAGAGAVQELVAAITNSNPARREAQGVFSSLPPRRASPGPQRPGP